MRLDNESLNPILLMIAALAFGACGGTTTGPTGVGGSGGVGDTATCRTGRRVRMGS